MCECGFQFIMAWAACIHSACGDRAEVEASTRHAFAFPHMAHQLSGCRGKIWMNII